MKNFYQKYQLMKMKLLAAFIRKLKLYEKHSDRSHYIVSLSMGTISFEVLRCAVTLNIFDELDKKQGQTLDELSASLNLERYPLQICLRALDYLKLVITIDGHYYNQPVNTMSFLTKYRDIFHFDTQLDYMHHIVGPACFYLEQSVLSNKPQGLYNLFGKDCNFYDAISKDKERMTYFDAFMKNITNRNKDRVTSDPFFSRHKRVLDVGGSTGDIAISLAQYHPELQVTVLDFPEVVKIASQKFKDCGFEKRLHTCTGDPLKALPAGYDCILFFHFFDIFSPTDIEILLRNAYEALPSGGSIGIFTPVSYSHRAAYSDLYGPYFLCLAEGQGKFYTQEDIVAWTKQKHFTELSVKQLPFSEVFISAVKS
jgi:ubiquinone/menaquinone biosynthesis C-methylase UbiE